MPKPKSKSAAPLTVDAFRHDEAKRRNIPTAEHRSVVPPEIDAPLRVAYERRNRDLDPQLVWRGKDQQDVSDLVVNAPPLYIQEKVNPKALVDDLRRASERERAKDAEQVDLFADFDGIADEGAKTEFYRHDGHWSNRMILGDSLQVMASLAEREALRGKVQCIYFDPPYGIKFNSNFQWSTTSTDARDGNPAQITREPEQVKAFRDTWRDGTHSYLTYLRDRLLLAHALLNESGSIFVQIGDENVHLLRSLLDGAFGASNFCAHITFRKKTMPLGSDHFEGVSDYILWYAKNKSTAKTRPLLKAKDVEGDSLWGWARDENAQSRKLSVAERASHRLLSAGDRVYRLVSLLPAQYRSNQDFEVAFNGNRFQPPKKSCWKTTSNGMTRMMQAGRIQAAGEALQQVLFFDDYPVSRLTALWADTGGASEKTYVVQTSELPVQRCILSCTDPGDLVLDPTCGSGTTAYVAEQWGRRWITVDTSRVALALARARIMGARYPYYLLADSIDGQRKEAEVTRTAPSTAPVRGKLSHGFVYERVPHVTLKSIANNAEIDVIWERFQALLEPLRERLNAALGKTWQEWEIPREADPSWPDATRMLHADWWSQRIARQTVIDASIAARAEVEHLYDRPYEDRRKVRVAGPFTVESLSPHRTLGIDADDALLDPAAPRAAEPRGAEYLAQRDFAAIMLEQLRTAGVQQSRKADRIAFTSLVPWPGHLICAEGRYLEGERERRAGVLVGPEFGTVSRPDLVAAAREAGDAGFDVLIACAFNFDAHSTDLDRLGRIPVLKARMNADLHMAEDLKNTGRGNLFVVFGEPDIDILPAPDECIRVKVNGVDVFHPSTGEVRSDGADGIACWFVDTDYDEESFFVRHAYFLGANDPYKSLKTTLKADIDPDAWASLNSDTSRPFPRPRSGRIAVKVINHLGDEVMKVFKT